MGRFQTSKGPISFYHNRNPRVKIKALIHVALAFLGIFWLLKLFSSYPSTLKSVIHQRQPTIGKVTMLYGNHTIYERALRTHEEHSRRLGYPLVVLRDPILDGYWNKYAILMLAMLKELEKPADQRLQWLFWFDADTVLMNPNMPLETFLPPPHLADIHMLLTEDWNGMNNGVFLIRVHLWSIKLLSAATAYPVLNPKVDLFWHDQSALSNLFKDNAYLARPVVYCPLRWFNAYMRAPNGEGLNLDSPAHLQVHPGDLLVHFPGTPREKLEETLNPYIAIAEEHRPEWELPLESTEYIETTKLFWNHTKSP